MFLPVTQPLTIGLGGRGVGPRGGPQLARVQDLSPQGVWDLGQTLCMSCFSIWEKGHSNFLPLDFSSGCLVGGTQSGGFESKHLLPDLVDSLHSSQSTVHEQGPPQPLKLFLLLCKAWNRNDFVYLPRLSLVPSLASCLFRLFPLYLPRQSALPLSGFQKIPVLTRQEEKQIQWLPLTKEEFW